MLKRWIQKLGLVRESESRQQRQDRQTAVSLDLSIQLKNNTVRIVHAGGKEELYYDVIPASQVMAKNPGMCIGLPEIFKRPVECLISEQDYLIPGQKYYLVPCSTYEKLKRRYLHKRKLKQLPYYDGTEEPILAIKDVSDVVSECSDESVCSAKDFFESRETWSIYSQRKSRKVKKPFVPPIQKPRPRKELEWEPGLCSIQEVSP